MFRRIEEGTTTYRDLYWVIGLMVGCFIVGVVLGIVLVLAR